MLPVVGIILRIWRVAHALRPSGSGTGQLTHLPARSRALLAPLIADSFGYTFWVAFGLTVLAFLPAAFLVRQPARLPQPGSEAPADATHAQ